MYKILESIHDFPSVICTIYVCIDIPDCVMKFAYMYENKKVILSPVNYNEYDGFYMELLMPQAKSAIKQVVFY